MTAQRHPATVTWFMASIGLKPLGNVRKSPFLRGGRLVRPFAEEEDLFIVECGCAGLPLPVIAQRMADRFGHLRSRDTVSCRLKWLASDEAVREAA